MSSWVGLAGAAHKETSTWAPGWGGSTDTMLATVLTSGPSDRPLVGRGGSTVTVRSPVTATVRNPLAVAALPAASLALATSWY
jgi:hypothetical protein